MNRRLRLIVCAGALASAALAHQVSKSLAETLYTVPGTANPWLAGQAPGSSITITFNDIAYTDTMANQSPVEIDGVPLTSGEWLLFDVNGGTSNGPHPLYGPDGLAITRLPNHGGSMNGISNITAPLCSLVGVFLGKDNPQNVAAPSALDFSTDESLNFTELRPELQQVFFIGDGLDALNNLQKFYVPENATRLYLAIMDGHEWSNNIGALQVSVGRAIPTPAVASLLGLGGLAGLSRRRRSA